MTTDPFEVAEKLRMEERKLSACEGALSRALACGRSAAATSLGERMVARHAARTERLRESLEEAISSASYFPDAAGGGDVES